MAFKVFLLRVAEIAKKKKEKEKPAGNVQNEV